MSKYIVAISIDKVQTFLYYAIHAKTQENQSNSGTLRSVVGASKLISDELYQKIGLEERKKGKFSGYIKEIFLQCSGKCIFSTTLGKGQIEEKLSQLFKDYYLQFGGQILIKYLYFEKECSSDIDKLHVIRECEDRFKTKVCLNSIIRSNQAELFQLHTIMAPRKLKEIGMEYAMFASEINALRPEKPDQDQDQNQGQEPSHFRIAVIKADFDGMGTLLNGINDYDLYNDISTILSQNICLEQLGEQTSQMKKKNHDFKLYPLYAAGDDLFFAIPMLHLFNGIQVCKELLNKLNKEIGNACKDRGYKKEVVLSLSVGVDFTFNREPIRYYYERVQYQVDMAKKKEPPKVKKTGQGLPCMKVSINGYVFYDYDSRKQTGGKKSQKMKTQCDEEPNWSHFITTVKLVKKSINEKTLDHHFFYGLLRKITDPTVQNDDIKYSNAFFYHLISQYLNDPDEGLWYTELQIFERLLQQVTMKTLQVNENTKDKTQAELCFDEAHKKNLKTYVRLLLLFSDPRFQVREIKSKPLDDRKFKDVKRTVFNRTLRYIYGNNLLPSSKNEEASKMRAIFVKKDFYKPEKEAQEVQVYRTLRISSSMFHRLKHINRAWMNEEVVQAKENQRDVQEKSATMILAVNDSTQGQSTVLEDARKAEFKAPPRLYFEREKFLQLAGSSGLWINDYIDSLLIFYQFNELSIQYKTRTSPRNPEKQGRQGQQGEKALQDRKKNNSSQNQKKGNR